MQLTINHLIHGFRVTGIREMRDVEGTLYEMVHEKTGAQLVWLKRSEINKTFCIGFKTIPSDDTGVFHICEHSVLSGSQKYPVREPFVDLLKSSMQTFLNAMTYPDKTIYPVSSRNDTDFMNLMDVYLDGVLHPAIYTNPNIFYQEGWHYEIREAEAEPVFKGVVFNEMKGAFSSVDEIVINQINRSLFPENCYQYCSGGDPQHIPDLSYEQFKKAHSTFYHPSNSRTFLDGAMDIDAVLKKIDEDYFSAYEKEEMDFTIPMQQIVDAVDTITEYEIGQDEEAQDKAVYCLAKIVCSYESIEAQCEVDLLASALASSNESPLKQAVLEQELCQDIEMGVMTDIQQPYMYLLFRNTSQDKVEQIRETLRRTVKELAEKGLDHKELLASINSMEYNYRDKKEPAGVIMAANSYRSWMYSSDPAMYLNASSIYDHLRQKVEEGYFETLIQELLLDDAHLCSVLALPSKTSAQAREAREHERLTQAKASWGAEVEKYIELNRKLDEWQGQPDTPEQKATLPKLKLADVNERPEDFPYTLDNYRGVPILVYPEEGNGIVSMNLYFSIAGITREQLSSAALFTDLMIELPTQNYTVLALQQELKAYVGKLSFGLEAVSPLDDRGKCKPMLCARCNVLKQNIHKAVELINEIVRHTVYEKETVYPLLQQKAETLRQMNIGSGDAVARIRAAAHFSAEAVVSEYSAGYEQTRYINAFLENYDAYIEEFLNECQLYQENFFISSRLTVSVTGEAVKEEVIAWIDTLETGQAERCYVRYPLLKEKKEGIVIPAQISYSAVYLRMTEEDRNIGGSVFPLAHMLTYDYLWNQIRVKGGAYGTRCTIGITGGMTCSSYRDPTPMRSLANYQEIPNYIEQQIEEGIDMTSYIIGAVAATEPLRTYAQKVRINDVRYFTGITYESRLQTRKQMLNTSAADLKKMCMMIQEGMKDVVQVVVGSKDVLAQDPEIVIISQAE